MEDQIWTLLARKFAGEASPEELALLRDLLEQDPAIADMVNAISADWYHPGITDMQKALLSFSRIETKIKQGQDDFSNRTDARIISSRRLNFFRKHGHTLIKVAACLVLVLGAWFYLYNQPGNDTSTEIAKQEIKAPEKNIREVTLSDGSTIWLNEGSTISVSKEFNLKKRELWLIGEAFFDVAKNKEKPFIIHTNKINIKVLGTAFNVKSYPEEKSVETSLIRGSVEITLDEHPDAKYILKPNQKLVIPVVENQEDVHISASGKQKQEDAGVHFSTLGKVPDGHSGEIIAEVSWKERKLAFYETSFSELAEQLEKRFQVPLVFEDKITEDLVFTGVFNKETLAQVLHALSLSAPFHYRIENDKVIILK